MRPRGHLGQRTGGRPGVADGAESAIGDGAHEVPVQPQDDAPADELTVDVVGGVVEFDDAVAGHGPVDFGHFTQGKGEVAVDAAQRAVLACSPRPENR